MLTSKHTRNNPFQIGRPITNPAEFIGRSQLIEKVLDVIKNRQHLSIVGERYMGKTSLLLYLLNKADVDLPKNYISVYIDFKSKALARASENVLWQHIVMALDAQLGKRFSGEKAILEKIKAKMKIASEYPLLEIRKLFQDLSNLNLEFNFLFDNFDQVYSNPNVENAFLSNLRGLSAASRNISFVVTSKCDLTDVETGKGESSFYSMFKTENLSLFEENDGYKLLMDAFVATNLGLDTEEKFNMVDKIWSFSEYVRDLTGYHPYLLQALFRRLYSHLEEEDWPFGEPLYPALLSFANDAKRVFDEYVNSSSESEVNMLKKLSENSLSIEDVENDPDPDSLRLFENLKRRNLITPVNEDQSEWQLFSSFFALWLNGKLTPKFIKGYVDKISGKTTRSEKAVHLFTGGKGGVGKTLLSLTTTIQYAKNKKVLCLDLNFENTDISRILFSSRDDAPSGIGKFVYASFGNLMVLRPSLLYNIPEAALGFWQLIRDGLKECYERLDFDPDIVVVDTNLHFASLLRTTGEAARNNSLKRIQSLSIEHNITQLNIWFVWTLTALTQKSGDLFYVSKTLSYLKKLSQKKPFFDPASNFVHVINPFALYSYFQEDANPKNVKSFATISKAKAEEGISLSQFSETTTNVLQRTRKRHTYLSPDFLEALGEELQKEYNSGRPKNVVIIPSFEQNVVGFVDYFVTAESLTYDDIVLRLSSFSEHFNDFLVPLQKIKKT